MSKTLAEITKEAADLPARDRLKLARIMLDLSEEGIDDLAEAGQAWDEEIERRIEEMRSGRVRGIPLEIVQKRIEARIRR